MLTTRVLRAGRWRRCPRWGKLAVLGVCLASVLLAGCHLYPNYIVVYTFADYLDPAVVRQFELETGTLVRLKTYRNNREMIARLKVSWAEFDVVMPSNYVLDFLIQSQLLAPLDRPRLPMLRHVDAMFTPADFKRELAYAVPYFWTTFGIVYREGEVTRPPRTWEEFFSPDFMGLHAGRISLPNESREVTALAALASGFSPNTVSESELEKVRAYLMAFRELRPRLSDSAIGSLAGRTASIGLSWVPTAVMAGMADPRIKLIVPPKGVVCVVDTLAIPASSRRKAAAAKFINFLLRPEIAARLTNYSTYPTTVTSSFAAVSPALRATHVLDLPALESLYVMRGVDAAEHIYDAMWVTFTRGLPVDR